MVLMVVTTCLLVVAAQVVPKEWVGFCFITILFWAALGVVSTIAEHI